MVAVYCLPVSICISGGLPHPFTSADVVAAGILVAGKLAGDFDEHAINGTITITNVKNKRISFGFFMIPPAKIKS
jgi:uncharacterized Fe-S cluster-containing radical SAM superfamily enzyme